MKLIYYSKGNYLERNIVMTYKITTTTPETQKEQIRLDAARRVYEELLRYIDSRDEKST